MVDNPEVGGSNPTVGGRYCFGVQLKYDVHLKDPTFRINRFTASVFILNQIAINNDRRYRPSGTETVNVKLININL